MQNPELANTQTASNQCFICGKKFNGAKPKTIKDSLRRHINSVHGKESNGAAALKNAADVAKSSTSRNDQQHLSEKSSPSPPTSKPQAPHRQYQQPSHNNEHHSGHRQQPQMAHQHQQQQLSQQPQLLTPQQLLLQQPHWQYYQLLPPQLHTDLHQQLHQQQSQPQLLQQQLKPGSSGAAVDGTGTAQPSGNLGLYWFG